MGADYIRFKFTRLSMPDVKQNNRGTELEEKEKESFL